jgi:succinate dehydrogenase / fumarate reductase cytochrome b subunit
MNNRPSAKKFLGWFNPFGRNPGSWAFILSRITALGLTFYLFLHLIVLGRLSQGPQAYEEFLALTENPVVKIGELAVIGAVIYHGLNGLRIVFTSFGIGVTRQTQLFYVSVILSFLGTIIFAIRMFAG